MINTDKDSAFLLSIAHIAGLFAFQVSIILAFINLNLAIIPLIFFLVLCFFAPFCIRYGFFLPIISHGSRKNKSVALTFDDGPDPHVTPYLLKLLFKYSIKATFFVIGERVTQHPEIIENILKEGHSIGNHSYSHDPILMLRKGTTLYHQIELLQKVLHRFGVIPLAFRPPVGITNPKLRRVLLEQGMYCINFSCRAFDRGNKNIHGLAKKILKKIKPGDIILLHDSKPEDNFNINTWLNEIEQLLKGLKENDLYVCSLSEVIDKPVMKLTSPVPQNSIGTS